ncbi:MAG TPA: class I SAM-dependent methyltransferase, partial [Rugosimonospora sp.]
MAAGGPAFGSGSLIDFMAPLSADRAGHLVRDLAARRPETIVDYGCGWGELLLRIAAALPDTKGVGIDTHGPDIERARSAAADRAVDSRVTFVDGPAESY